MVTSKTQDHLTKINDRRQSKSIARVIVVGFAWLGITLGAVLFAVAVWIRNTFGVISIDQMLLNMPGVAGAEATTAESIYIQGFLVQAILTPLMVVLLVYFLSAITRRWMSARSTAGRGNPGKHRVSSPIVNWLGHFRDRRWVALPVAILTFGTGTFVFLQAIDVGSYIRSLTTGLTMGEYYVAPEIGGATEIVQQDSETPAKNLVLIFLESIEDEMGNPDVFSSNMLGPLQEITSEWSSISDYQEYGGGGWTMAGLVGTSCGVPLRGVGVGEGDLHSNDIGNGADDYLPGAVCLGDVLSDNGYTNIFMGGADAEFASKGRFLRDHGYQEINELSTWLELGENEVSNWGLSDRRLMEHAKEEVTRLHDAGAPFNLTLLTVDSHEPAYPFEYCQQTTEVYLESGIRCSMEQVAEFIKYMESAGYLEDTLVVLTADHKKMIGEGMPSMSELRDLENRPLFNRIWDPSGPVELRERSDQLSMFATVLDMLGLGREDHLAGVGVSALVTSAAGSVLDLDEAQYTDLIHSRSKDLYAKLWNPKSLVAAT